MWIGVKESVLEDLLRVGAGDDLEHRGRVDAILMEYAPGGDLFDRLMKSTAVTPGKLRSWALQLVLAVEHLHEQVNNHLKLPILPLKNLFRDFRNIKPQWINWRSWRKHMMPRLRI